MAAIGSQLRESGRAFGDVFRNRALRRINLALAGSVIGDWAYGVAVGIWAFQDGGPTAIGVYTVARYVVMMITSPLMATLADRADKKRVMIAADLLRAALVAVAAIVLAADGPSLAVYALALATAVVGGAFRPSQGALLPQLASDPKELTGANVVASTIESLGFFVGPAIGAALLAVADVPVVFAFNAATFVWSAALILRLHVAHAPADVEAPPPETALEQATAAPGFLGELTAGFRTVVRNRELRLISAMCAAQTVVAGAAVVFEVTIALDLLELGESGVGLLGSLLGVGGLAGGLLVMVLAGRDRLATDFGIGVLLWSAPLLLVVAWPTVASALVAMFLLGLGNSMVDINAFTIIQRIAPAEVMGRVFGAFETIYIGGMALGALAMPLLIDTIGLRSGLAVIGATVAVLALAGLTGLVRIDRTILAPPGLALLRRVPMLAPLPAPALERLAHSLVEVRVPAGIPVFRQGDRGDRFYVVEAGHATVSIGGEHVRDLGPGDGFGEIALLRDVPRTATVAAGDDGLVLMGLDRDVFIPAVTGYGEASEVADAVVERWLAFG